MSLLGINSASLKFSSFIVTHSFALSINVSQGCKASSIMLSIVIMCSVVVIFHLFTRLTQPINR